MDDDDRAGGEFHQSGKPAERPDNVLPNKNDRRQGDVFLAAVQLTRMAMALSDPTQPDNPLVYVNPSFLEQTGYAADEVLGRNCRFLQGANTDPDTVRRIREALAAHESIDVEIYNYRRDGTGFWNALYVCPLFDEGGRLVHFFASQVDVTKLKEATFRQRQNLDTVGSLASGVAHTVNNLLTVVLSGIEQAGRKSVGDAQSLALAHADAATRSAGRLTQQMLSFARRQFLAPQTVDLNALVRALDDLVRQMAENDTVVSFDLAPYSVFALLDAGQFELALVALVRNAVDASAPGGRVIVATREYTSWQAAEERSGSEWVELAVIDLGRGMSAEVSSRAMEPFYSTKPNGTGMGLSSVVGYVEQSGGKLSIESQVGIGTTVRLAFPKQAASLTSLVEEP